MGPMVFCVEAVDNADFASSKLGLDAFSLDVDAPLEVGFDNTLSLPAIFASATYTKPSSELYSTKRPDTLTTKIKFIPYLAFANRGASDMQVWVLAK